MQAPVQPPFIPNHLVRLLVCGENAEAIAGDLAEEFAELVSKEGLEYARRWYWRQSAKTVADLTVATFRTAPWMMATTIVGGFLLLGFALSLPERMIDAVLDWHRHRVIPYYTWPQMQSYLFWLNNAILEGRLIIAIPVGCIVALIAKRREMIATTVLGFLWATLYSMAFLVWFAKPAPWHPPVWFAIMTSFVYPLALVHGGIIVREARSHTTRSEKT